MRRTLKDGIDFTDQLPIHGQRYLFHGMNCVGKGYDGEGQIGAKENGWSTMINDLRLNYAYNVVWYHHCKDKGVKYENHSRLPRKPLQLKIGIAALTSLLPSIAYGIASTIVFGAHGHIVALAGDRSSSQG